jgi:TonB family protein
MLKLVLIASLLGATSFVARGDSGYPTPCLRDGSWTANMVLADHVDPIQFNLFVRRDDEYLTLGDGRYLLRAGVYGVVHFGKDHNTSSIEKAILKCRQLTFEVHAESNVLVKFRLDITDAEVEGEAEFPDRVARVALMQRPWGRSAPILMRKEDPKYTDEARRAQLQGEVVLLLQIDPSGRTYAARVVRGLGFGLNESAIEAVKHWEFKFNNSTPSAACEIKAGVQFRLP